MYYRRMKKECSRCHSILSIDCFHKTTRNKDGHSNVCKKCRKEQEHYRYAKDKERILNNVWEYREKNRLEIRRKGREKYHDNIEYKEKTLKYQKQYRANNRERINKTIQNYRKTPEGNFKQRQKDHNRRIIEIECVGSHSFEEWENIKRNFNYTCPACGKSEPEIVLTEDHIVPLIKGGTNWISNIQPLCKSCNSKKGGRVQRWAAQDLQCYIPDPSEEATDVPA